MRVEGVVVRAAVLKEAARAWLSAGVRSIERGACSRRHAGTFGDDLPTLTRARQQSTPLPLSPHFNTRP